MYKSHNMSLLRDMKLTSRDRIFLSRDKSVDLIGALSCRATLFELRHNLLSLRGGGGGGRVGDNNILKFFRPL